MRNKAFKQGHGSMQDHTYRDLDHVSDQSACKHASHEAHNEIVHLPSAWSPDDVPRNEHAGRATC